MKKSHFSYLQLHLLLILTLYTAAEAFAQKTPRVCYEIFVRSFCDSNHDGIGDINGITSKLDYLQDLGVEAIWLTPVTLSPSYHKYDIVDYKKIDPEYGTLEDYKRLIVEAHKRNILVIKDLVINHTSSKHFWFQEAQKGKDNPYRNYYSWMTPQKIDSMGIAVREKTADSWETQPWHWAKKGDDEKYYGMFWSGMPDLNMDNSKVREEIYEIGRFWLQDVGIDGFRLDAAKHIYPDWEAEKCHAFWQEFREKMEAVKPNVYIVGEVWTSAEKVAPFFRGLKANFHFDLSFALQKIVKAEQDSVALVKLLLSNYKTFAKENPAFIDATMLTNHDQNRIGSVLSGNKNQLKVAANLLLTLTGNPFIYYGEELGMMGVKPDENIREAFLWDKRFDDKCRTNWRKPQFNTDSKVTPLKQQSTDPNSLYNHYKKLIHLRNNQPALWQILPPNLQKSQINQKGILAFIRPHASGDLLVIHNLSNKSHEIVLKNGEEAFNKVIFKTENSQLHTNHTCQLAPYSVLVLGK